MINPIFRNFYKVQKNNGISRPLKIHFRNNRCFVQMAFTFVQRTGQKYRFGHFAHPYLKKHSLSLNDSINLFKILLSQHHSPDFIFRYKQHHKIQRYLSFEITPDNKWNEIQVHVFTKHCFIRNQCFLHSYTLLSTEC